MKTILGLLITAGLAGAMCPPCSRRPQKINIVDAQRVFVFHRGGMEDLILQSSYKGSASDFGMILPLPSVPEVRMVRKDYCDAIAKIAQEPNLKEFGDGAESLKRSSGGRAPEIEVLKRQVAGVYEAVTLKARSLKALRAWLKEHKYTYVDDKYADKVFQSYIDKEWVFVAVRVNVTFKGKRFDGSFRPMGFRFRSPHIIVPTRVASIYPQGMPFAIYVLSNTAVDFPTVWGRGRVTTFALSSEQLLASPAIRRELEENAVLDRSGSLKKLAKSIQSESKEDYEAFLRRKTTGLYLSKFAGRFSREQLSKGDLVFERDSLIDKDQVNGYVKDLQGTELKKVKVARRILSAAGVGHIPTLAAHLKSAHSQLRITLSGILSLIGDLEAVPHLIEALASEKDRLARSAIHRALRELTGHDPEGGDWKKWWERLKK